MAQGKLRDGFDIFLADRISTAPCRVGPGATQPDQVRAQTVDTGGKTALGDLCQGLVIQLDCIEPRPCLSATRL